MAVDNDTSRPDPDEPQSRLQSPRFLRRLTWVAALILVAGIVAFAVAFIGSSGPDLSAEATEGQGPAVATPVKKTVPLDPKARTVAGKFILTAVARKNLAESWEITHPDLKQGLTKKQWLTGAIPVQFYPAGAIDTASFAIDESHEDEVVLQVAVLPKEGSKVPAQIFYVGLKAEGKGKDKKWLVNYFQPRAIIAVPNVGDN
jgi:hypothetical protein